MDARAIGIFDSGVGGLTVFKTLEAALPREALVYLGDTARVPYGPKSAETVCRYGTEAARFFRKHDVKMLVVACNTVSSVALDVVAEEASVPVVGVIVPGARRAASLSAAGRIGVIGTRATVESQSYPRAILALRSEAVVISHPCPLFVPLAEEGWTENEVARSVAEAYLAPLREARIDTLVLGCTHYPLLRETIGRVMGSDVALVDSAEAVAAEIKETLSRDRALAAPDRGEDPARQFYVTDAPAPFLAVAERFLGRPVGPIWRARIEGDEVQEQG
jgi:glutamate racemase